MTYELVCSRCGYAIYSGFDLRPPAEILKSFGERCGKCKTKLMTDTFKVEVERFDGNFAQSAPKIGLEVAPKQPQPLAMLPSPKARAVA